MDKNIDFDLLEKQVKDEFTKKVSAKLQGRQELVLAEMIINLSSSLIKDMLQKYHEQISE